MYEFFLKFLSFFFAHIGFRGCRLIGYCMGFFVFDILSIRKKIVMYNIDVVFGNTISTKEKKRIGRMSYVNSVTSVFETMGSYKLFLKARVDFENKGIFDDAFVKKNGIYMILIHMGNFELLGYIHKDYDPFCIVKDLSRKNLDDYLTNIRIQNGIKLIKKSDRIMRTKQLFSLIENKKMVFFPADQKRPNGEMIPFFGKMASTNNSLAKLYFRKQAPIIPFIITRKKIGTFKIKYFDEFIYEKKPQYSLQENITAFTTQMNCIIEKMILECPQEYMWGHNRWSYKKQ